MEMGLPDIVGGIYRSIGISAPIFQEKKMALADKIKKVHTAYLPCWVGSMFMPVPAGIFNDHISQTLPSTSSHPGSSW